MGIISKLFGRSNARDGSYVRAWANRRKRELRRSGELTPENLFAVIMYRLATFGKTPEVKDFGFDASGNYSGDAALFELGCYIYFRLDLWLYMHESERREEISQVFIREFRILFTDALHFTNIAEAFEQRVRGFGQLAQTEADIERYHFHLLQLILKSNDDQPPADYDFENPHVVFTGNLGVKIALMSCEQVMLPGMLERLKSYCNQT
jgi:hypothetical protein